MESNHSHKNILIVDDTPDNLTILRQILTEEGYQVRPALNGEVALKTIQTEPPDLILLDIIMPKMDGFEVCSIIKSSKQTRDIPIIFISALSKTENIVKAFKAGGVDYITKPFQTEEVLSRVRTHLGLQNAIQKEEASHMMLQTILNSIENTIITINSKLEIINSNKDLDNICIGFSQDNKSFADRLKNGSGPCVEALQQTLNTNKPVREYRVACSCEGDTGNTMVLNTAPLNHQHNVPGGAVLIIRDITRLVELEKNLLEQHSFHNIIGKNKKMQEIYTLLERTADLDVNMLICGDSGTGKELIAEAIHYSGSRAAGPLIKVNCAALPENLLESELFGHVKGAFTGAIKDRVGRFQAAQGGTLFLDEIGDISLQFQAKLLRFLELKEFERIGDSKTLKADVRVVAATNQDLSIQVSEKKFREDLFYRLKGVLIQLPALKERADDIFLLAKHFIRIFRKSLCKNIEGISNDVQRIFLEYSWPGNVRELKSVLHHACALCPEEIIHKEHLPQELFSETALAQLARRKTDSPGNSHHKESEKETIKAFLDKTDWNKAKTARLLGVSRATLCSTLNTSPLCRHATRFTFLASSIVLISMGFPFLL
ncbi:sigma-54 dependent transcriptional regulator [Desulfobacterales bacterium HSG17]|nr:sigma-54 dependent transcriptional regulator [Desulfobacterales bacterium HSG17]